MKRKKERLILVKVIYHYNQWEWSELDTFVDGPNMFYITIKFLF